MSDLPSSPPPEARAPGSPGQPPPAGVGGIRVKLEPVHVYKAVGLVFLLALTFRFFTELTQIFLLAYAAAIIAVALNPLARRMPGHRAWVSGLVAVLVLGALVGLVWLVAPLMADQIRSFVENIPEYEEQLEAWGDWVREETGLDVQLLSAQAADALRNFFRGLETEAIFGRARGLLEILIFPFLVLLGGLYALARPNDRLLTPILRIVPRDRRPAFQRIFHLLGVRLLGWIRGTLLAMVAVGVLATIAFYIIGVPNALLLGVVLGLVEFIPIIGPWIGGIPAVLVALLDDPMKAVWVVVAVLAIQWVESNLITPWAMSTAARIHPAVTLFGLILFGTLFGFLGILLAVPLVILIWTLVEVLWVEQALGTERDAFEPVVKEKKEEPPDG